MVDLALSSEWLCEDDYETDCQRRTVDSLRKEKQPYSTRFVRRCAKTPALRSGVHRRRIKKGAM